MLSGFQDQFFPEYQDYEDWDEHNAGRTLLDYMIDAELENRAIFVVRNYEGTHIGAKRFECLIDAAKWAVNYKPFNRVTNEFQFSWQQKKHGRGGGIGGRIPHMDELPRSMSSANDTDSEVVINDRKWDITQAMKTQCNQTGKQLYVPVKEKLQLLHGISPRSRDQQPLLKEM